MKSENNELVNDIVESLTTNVKFIKKNIPELYNEVIELINDIIDYMFKSIHNLPEDFVEKCILYDNLWFIIIPQSYTAYIILLLGNIASYFLHLRIILESMLLGVYLDLKYGLRMSINDKLSLDEYRYFSPKKLQGNITKIIGEDLTKRIVDLWEELSSRWTHPASRKSSSKRLYGLLGEINEYLKKHGMPPSYAIIIPINYDKHDLDLLNETKELTKELRELLNELFTKWYEAALKNFENNCY